MLKIQKAYQLNFLFRISGFVILNLFGTLIFAQEQEETVIPADTNIYFTDYSELLAVQVFTQTRTNMLDIVYEDEKLLLRPNGMTNLGFGGSWKGLALNLSFGLPKTGGSTEKYGETKRYDIQFSSMTDRFYFDGFLSGYKGYYNDNPQDFIDWENDYFPQIPNLTVSSVGLSGFYIFNNKKYSYKAAYKRTAVQHKSAGSFALGIYGNYDDVNTDNGFIPKEFPDSIKSDFDLKAFTNLAVGISFGYAYTFVLWKNVVLNLGAFPGIGIQQSSMTSLTGVNTNTTKLGEQIKGTAALGYEYKSFYLGFYSSATLRFLDYNDYEIDLSTEQFRFYVGKRFKL